MCCGAPWKCWKSGRKLTIAGENSFLLSLVIKLPPNVAETEADESADHESCMTENTVRSRCSLPAWIAVMGEKTLHVENVS